MDRQIQIAVARADLIICTALRWIGVFALCAAVLLLTIIAVRAWAADPDLIDYDAPGVDITSEGP